MFRHLNSTIIALSAVAIVVMFVSSGEAVIPVLRGTSLESILLAYGKANSIAFNLSVGYLVSVLFWLLVVLLPECARRRLLQDNLS